jgi:hypothetical protein
MITYSVSRYAGKRTRLTKSVRLTGWFCTVTGVGPENLPENVRNVFEPSRDEGYWLWKYIIIYQKIMELDYGEFLTYVDAGCTINPGSHQRLSDIQSRLSSTGPGVLAYQTAHAELPCTKRERFYHLRAPVTGYSAHTGQYSAAILYMRKTPRLVEFFEDLLTCAMPDATGGLVKHRHDKSLISHEDT